MRKDYVEHAVAVLESVTTGLELLREYNPYHDALGRFAPKQGGGSGFAPKGAASSDVSYSDAQVEDALGAWLIGGGSNGKAGYITQGSREIMSGKFKPGKQGHDEAAALMSRVESGGPHAAIHRGVALDAKTLASFTEGAEFTLPLSSFSKSKEVAGGFGKMVHASNPSKTPVIFTAANVHGFAISGSKSAKDYGMDWQKEVITGGHFKVKRRRMDADGTWIIDIEVAGNNRGDF